MKVRAVISPQEEAQGFKRYTLFCPACKCGHTFRTGPGQWTFNGNMDKPTIQPSIMVTRPDDDSYRCHSYVIDGNIQFLADCLHDLRNKTVPLEDF